MQHQSFKTVDMVVIKYTDLPGSFPSWQDPCTYRPMPFDLVEIQTPRGIKSGWWTGNKWMGVRLRKEDTIISWKKSRELDFI